ncbi:hypothetical protein D3C87_1780150 [compost metagenome]
MQFGIGAAPRERPRIKNIVAGFEELCFRATRNDGSGRVPAEGIDRFRHRDAAGADLRIDRVDGDRLNSNQQIMRTRNWRRDICFEEHRFVMACGMLLKLDGFHCFVLRLRYPLNLEVMDGLRKYGNLAYIVPEREP